jgi:hypothetical protein
MEVKIIIVAAFETGMDVPSIIFRRSGFPPVHKLHLAGTFAKNKFVTVIHLVTVT